MRLINRHPGRASATLLGLLPFLLIMLIYSLASQERLAENPNDKLLPGLEQMTAAVDRMAFKPDRRSGDYLMWQDTTASLERLASASPRRWPWWWAFSMVFCLWPEPTSPRWFRHFRWCRLWPYCPYFLSCSASENSRKSC